MLGTLATTSPASAAPLINGFGGPANYGTSSLPSNDDGSSSAIDLTTAFPGGLTFFGGPYMQTWVNTNGNITFAGALPTFTPNAFPVASRPMIAPYWGDVDIRGTPRTATSNQVYWHLQPGMMVVTWHNVGYYNSQTDRRMDFQMILRNALGCGMGDFDVEFRYNRCEWTTGSASGGTGGFGGTPAQAGFDAGNGMDFVEIPGSRTMAILDLCTTSNVGEAGIWRFSVRSGAVTCPDAGESCTIDGALGACSLGITQCVGREIECSPIGTSTEERCDGVDNDCDGEIDDGELCASPNVCVRGACVPPCFEGGCPEGETCTEDGICVETACGDVECPPGQRCVGGACVGACDGVTCPHDRQCVAGRCIDLCSVLTCNAGEICVDGACQPQCPCTACAAGETCLADGSCEQPGCDITICEAGSHCVVGTCMDSCAGAVCPAGQRCEVGECIDIPPMERPDAGPIGPGPGTDSGGPIGPGTDAGTGEPEMDAGRTPGGTGGDAGCGCRTVASGRDGFALLLGVLVLSTRRRKR